MPVSLYETGVLIRRAWEDERPAVEEMGGANPNPALTSLSAHDLTFCLVKKKKSPPENEHQGFESSELF